MTLLKKLIILTTVLLVPVLCSAELVCEPLISTTSATYMATNTYITLTADIGKRRGTFGYYVEVANCAIDIRLLGGDGDVASGHQRFGDQSCA